MGSWDGGSGGSNSGNTNGSSPSAPGGERSGFSGGWGGSGGTDAGSGGGGGGGAPAPGTYTDSAGNVHVVEDYSSQGGYKYDTVVAGPAVGIYSGTPGQGDYFYRPGSYSGSGFEEQRAGILSQRGVQAAVLAEARNNERGREALEKAGIIKTVPAEEPGIQPPATPPPVSPDVAASPYKDKPEFWGVRPEGKGQAEDIFRLLDKIYPKDKVGTTEKTVWESTQEGQYAAWLGEWTAQQNEKIEGWQDKPTGSYTLDILKQAPAEALKYTLGLGVLVPAIGITAASFVRNPAVASERLMQTAPEAVLTLPEAIYSQFADPIQEKGLAKGLSADVGQLAAILLPGKVMSTLGKPRGRVSSKLNEVFPTAEARPLSQKGINVATEYTAKHTDLVVRNPFDNGKPSGLVEDGPSIPGEPAPVQAGKYTIELNIDKQGARQFARGMVEELNKIGEDVRLNRAGTSIESVPRAYRESPETLIELDYFNKVKEEGGTKKFKKEFVELQGQKDLTSIPFEDISLAGEDMPLLQKMFGASEKPTKLESFGSPSDIPLRDLSGMSTAEKMFGNKKVIRIDNPPDNILLRLDELYITKAEPEPATALIERSQHNLPVKEGTRAYYSEDYPNSLYFKTTNEEFVRMFNAGKEAQRQGKILIEGDALEGYWGDIALVGDTKVRVISRGAGYTEPGVIPLGLAEKLNLKAVDMKLTPKESRAQLRHVNFDVDVGKAKPDIVKDISTTGRRVKGRGKQGELQKDPLKELIEPQSGPTIELPDTLDEVTIFMREKYGTGKGEKPVKIVSVKDFEAITGASIEDMGLGGGIAVSTGTGQKLIVKQKQRQKQKEKLDTITIEDAALINLMSSSIDVEALGITLKESTGLESKQKKRQKIRRQEQEASIIFDDAFTRPTQKARGRGKAVLAYSVSTETIPGLDIWQEPKQAAKQTPKQAARQKARQDTALDTLLDTGLDTPLIQMTREARRGRKIRVSKPERIIEPIKADKEFERSFFRTRRTSPMIEPFTDVDLFGTERTRKKKGKRGKKDRWKWNF